MEKLTKEQAYNIIYELTGKLQLNRNDSSILNESLAIIYKLVTSDVENINKNINEDITVDPKR